MFTTLTQKILLGVYVFVLVSIPVGAYLVSQSQTIKSEATEKKTTKTIAQVTPRPIPTPVKQLLNGSATQASKSGALGSIPSSSEPSPSSPTIATSFGPTLSFKINIEGRPGANQAAKVFVGIAEGALTSNPKFLLNFNVDVPASGEYSGLSLAGLTTGSTYVALIKGPAQIANSISFTMSPTVTNLNGGQAVKLTSGDLNDDNVINTADYSVAQKAVGATPGSLNWNENADLNKDGLINAFDLGIISKNIGQTGLSGAWTSPIPKTATPSGGLIDPPAGSPEGGYWIWIPK